MIINFEFLRRHRRFDEIAFTFIWLSNSPRRDVNGGFLTKVSDFAGVGLKSVGRICWEVPDSLEQHLTTSWEGFGKDKSSLKNGFYGSKEFLEEYSEGVVLRDTAAGSQLFDGDGRVLAP